MFGFQRNVSYCLRTFGRGADVVPSATESKSAASSLVTFTARVLLLVDALFLIFRNLVVSLKILPDGAIVFGERKQWRYDVVVCVHAVHTKLSKEVLNSNNNNML